MALTRQRRRLAIVAGVGLYALCVARYAWAAYVLSIFVGTRFQRASLEHTELFWRLVLLILPVAALAGIFAVRWAMAEDAP